MIKFSWPFPFAVLLLWPSLSLGQSSDLAKTFELCQEAAVQEICMTTCATACKSSEFLTNHVDYCLSNGLIGGTSAPPADAASCSAIFGAAGDNAQPTPPAEVNRVDPPEPSIQPAVTEPAAKDEIDCSTVKGFIERKRCEQAKIAPKCAPTVTDLENQSRLLVTQIEAELSTYGELLLRDWSEINNRALLCAFTEADLEESYNLAAGNQDSLHTLQRQATSIQSCQSEWETLVRDNAGNLTSTDLIDVIARDAEKQLEPLKKQINRLSESIGQLQNAAKTIDQIGAAYVNFCDGKGTSLTATTGNP